MFLRRRANRIKHILIVEDEPLVAFDNEHFLRESGYDVVAAVDCVDDAIAALAAHVVDLVITDVRLSGEGDGMDVARAAMAQGVAVLFASGHCPVEARALAVGCLAKPYSQRTLKAAIEAVDALMSGRKVTLPEGFSVYA